MFVVYESVEEAAEARCSFVGWREAVTGDWFVSDDGFVCELLAVVKSGDILRWVVPHGTILMSKRKSLRLFDLIRKKRRSWAAVEVRRPRFRRVMYQYILDLLKDGTVDWNKLGMLYRKDQAVPAASVKRIFRNPEIAMELAKTLTSVLKDMGVNREWVILKMKDLAENSISEKEYGTAVRALAKLGEWAGMDREAKEGSPYVPQRDEAADLPLLPADFDQRPPELPSTGLEEAMAEDLNPITPGFMAPESPSAPPA